MEYNGERNEHGGIVAGSRQIYLTFPAESTFSEKDVSNYFNKYGPVQDVRISCQQKRMFGFMTFVFVETVKQILAKGNPHFVCGALVLVKPCKEKSRLPERKYPEKFSTQCTMVRTLLMQNLSFTQFPEFMIIQGCLGSSLWKSMNMHLSLRE